MIPEDAASLAGLLKATTFATEQDLIRYGALPFYLSLLVAKDGGRNCIVLEDTIKKRSHQLAIIASKVEIDARQHTGSSMPGMVLRLKGSEYVESLFESIRIHGPEGAEAVVRMALSLYGSVVREMANGYKPMATTPTRVRIPLAVPGYRYTQ
ncbi:MAG: hypothetical protein AAB870_01420 [Patescibacteria group bacterium]